jgi:predicted AlkP superfamily pyrophosphatase or phosphodiesterase
MLVGMVPTRKYRLILSLLITSALWAAPPETPRKPRLVLAIIIDQFRYDYLLRFRNEYHSGLARLLEKGAVFTDAHYLHAATVTAVGHSTFLSGAPPSISGIVGNELVRPGDRHHRHQRLRSGDQIGRRESRMP